MICACLSFWDETTATLTRCVKSLIGVCDYLVALDGPWALHPAEGCRATRDEIDAIIDAASGLAGKPIPLRAAVHFSAGIWPSQVAKRAELMRLAAETGSAWLLVIDADEWIEFAAPRLDVHEQLSATDRDVALVNQHRIGTGIRTHYRSMRRIYRAAAGVTVQTAHNGYRTADGRWLHGDPAYVKLEDAVDLSQLLTVGHDIEARTSVRRRAQLDYRSNRRRARAERWGNG